MVLVPQDKHVPFTGQKVWPKENEKKRKLYWLQLSTLICMIEFHAARFFISTGEKTPAFLALIGNRDLLEEDDAVHFFFFFHKNNVLC